MAATYCSQFRTSFQIVTPIAVMLLLLGLANNSEAQSQAPPGTLPAAQPALPTGNSRVASAEPADSSGSSASWLSTGLFRWKVGEPLISARPELLPPVPADQPWLAIKDPSIVRFGGSWHLFCSVRRKKEGNGRIGIGYASFDDWSKAGEASWSVLKLTEAYHGAPQIFYFRPHRRWYLIYQAADPERDLAYGPCYSTNDDISDPTGWSLPEPLFRVQEGQNAGLDFWVICDQHKAHLFFTTLNGQMWRAETAVDQFPGGDWSKPQVVLQADLFEASHTYRLAGTDKYLTIVEAQDGRRGRYFKAFTATKLDGLWSPLAASKEKPFAASANVVNQSLSWADSYSHGELLRAGYDERLLVDPKSLILLFQGASREEYQSGNYGLIPWKLGLLKRPEAP